MSLKASFIFLISIANSAIDRNVASTSSTELTAGGTASYDDAESVASDPVAIGIEAIELCGGFGTAGVERISRTFNRKAAVGAVRFDIHPGLVNKSGDAVYG